MSQISVVTNARYPICLDSGRHLHPGEVAVVEDSERHQHLIEQGHLRLTAVQPKPELPKPELPKPVTVAPDRPQEEK